MTRVAIVGGGIAGLSLAFALRKRAAAGAPLEISVLERAERAGGNLRSERLEGFLCEWGPNGFLDSVPETLTLVREAGLASRLVVSDDRARRRFIFRGGRLHELPGGPVGFLTSGLLSVGGRLRVLREPFAPTRPPGDETIHAFAARRIGREAADILIDSMVSGVFGGNARELSLQACFPKMWQMETEHGGLVRALLARRRQGRAAGGPVGAPAGRLTSFEGGIEDLARGLVAALGGAVQVRSGVERLEAAAAGRGWRLMLDGGRHVEADLIVLAGAASSSASIVSGLDGELASSLREIPTAPLAVVCLGYAERDLPRPLDGFGFLVPRGEGLRSLGALWDSSIYPGRAPAGHALIRVMVGGAHDPAAVTLEETDLVGTARADLAAAMNLTRPPVFTRVFRHFGGIPQYTVGHLDRLARIDARLAAHHGVLVAGNSYRGVAINACIADAEPLADRIVAAAAGFAAAAASSTHDADRS
jgi:oxygen-dependent protoporphyrinogen oxidase